MSNEETIDPAATHIPAASYPAMIETLASLLRRMELIESDQRQQAKSIDRAIRYFGELSARLVVHPSKFARLVSIGYPAGCGTNCTPQEAICEQDISCRLDA